MVDHRMDFRLTHWTGMAIPGERELKTILRREGLKGHCWTNRPGHRYRSHSHPDAKVVYCLAGDIVFNLAGNRVRMTPGDRLEIEAGTVHSADVGPRGVVCLEATRPLA